MANIPTIPNTAPVQDVQIGTKVDSRFQQGVISAQANVFSEAMNVVSDYELRKQKAEEVAGFNQASITLNKATADYQHNLKTMKDQDIVPKWQETAQKVKDDLLKNTEGWSGAAKRKFSQTLDTWQNDSTIQFQVAGDHLASERRKATAIAASNEFLQTGDPAYMENAKQAITSAVQAGDMTPTEGQVHIGAMQKNLEMNQVAYGTMADPFSMYDALTAKGDGGKYENFTSIPAYQRPRLIFEATRIANGVRAETMRGFTQAVADARDANQPLPDRDQLDVIAKKQGISPKWMDKLYAAPKPELDTTQYAKDVVELNHMNLVDDPDGKNAARATEIITGYKGTAATNLESIYKERKNPTSATNSPTATRAFKEMEDLFNVGAFGKFKMPSTGYDEQGNKLPPTEDIAKRTTAFTVYGDAMAQLRQWMSQNPEKVDDANAVNQQVKLIVGKLAGKDAGIDLRNHLGI